MENEEERGKSLSANDEVAAAAEAHGEVSAAAEVAQSDPGAGLLILAQQSQVQGGGSLAGLEHQSAYALIHQGLHVEDGGAEGGVIIGGVQRQHAAFLTGGVEHLLAQQTLDGVAGFALFHRRVRGQGSLVGDHHHVALNGVLHWGSVAAVVGVYLPHRNVRVESDVALNHDLGRLRGQITGNGRVLGVGGKGTHAHGGGHGQQRGSSGSAAGSVLVQQSHSSILL